MPLRVRGYSSEVHFGALWGSILGPFWAGKSIRPRARWGGTFLVIVEVIFEVICEIIFEVISEVISEIIWVHVLRFYLVLLGFQLILRHF